MAITLSLGRRSRRLDAGWRGGGRAAGTGTEPALPIHLVGHRICLSAGQQCDGPARDHEFASSPFQL